MGSRGFRARALKCFQARGVGQVQIQKHDVDIGLAKNEEGLRERHDMSNAE
jgi:hypothetical protein